MMEKQALFLRTISVFVQMAYDQGYLLTAGEFWRPEIVAEMYAKLNKGITNSLHWKRLAADLNAFFKGQYLDASMEWHIPHLEKLGKLWKSLHPVCAWGGDFKDKKDYNHYSFMHEGVR